MDESPLILSGKICPYCGKESELIDSTEIYNGKSYGKMYICRPCDAYVGVIGRQTRLPVALRMQNCASTSTRLTTPLTRYGKKT